ncbi:hypothetical protein JX265_013010 [Neoarthrinium moseri]|uniref:Uncharacterized protein n=1 Tax=Neoarthrinium moseri TaxID=1658444 RepID=A0A9P9W9H5_9PEZI|nr:hypothetical protein JX265_013010 [Neoarthrinium moseri]
MAAPTFRELEETAALTIRMIKHIPGLGHTKVAIIGGLAVWNYLPTQRRTDNIDLLIDASVSPSFVRRRLLQYPRSVFIQIGRSLWYQSPTGCEIEIRIISEDSVAYLPASAWPVKDIRPGVFPYISLSDLIVLKIDSCGYHRAWGARVRDAYDAAALLEYASAPHPLILSCRQECVVREGLPDVIEYGGRGKAWWLCRLGLHELPKRRRRHSVHNYRHKAHANKHVRRPRHSTAHDVIVVETQLGKHHADRGRSHRKRRHSSSSAEHHDRARCPPRPPRPPPREIILREYKSDHSKSHHEHKKPEKKRHHQPCGHHHNRRRSVHSQVDLLPLHVAEDKTPQVPKSKEAKDDHGKGQEHVPLPYNGHSITLQRFLLKGPYAQHPNEKPPHEKPPPAKPPRVERLPPQKPPKKRSQKAPPKNPPPKNPPRRKSPLPKPVTRPKPPHRPAPSPPPAISASYQAPPRYVEPRPWERVSHDASPHQGFFYMSGANGNTPPKPTAEALEPEPRQPEPRPQPRSDYRASVDSAISVSTPKSPTFKGGLKTLKEDSGATGGSSTDSDQYLGVRSPSDSEEGKPPKEIFPASRRNLNPIATYKEPLQPDQHSRRSESIRSFNRLRPPEPGSGAVPGGNAGAIGGVSTRHSERGGSNRSSARSRSVDRGSQKAGGSTGANRKGSSHGSVRSFRRTRPPPLVLGNPTTAEVHKMSSGGIGEPSPSKKVRFQVEDGRVSGVDDR